MSLPPLVPLPFLEAIAWAKARNVVLPAVYYQQLQGLARAMAFSVAGLTKLDQVQAVKDSLDAALETGASFGEWKKRVAAGEEPILTLPAHRLDNIFRTNLQGAYNRGRCEQQAAAVTSHPWYMLDAVNDSRTRPSHAAMDGKVARHDDPWWKTHTPPNGFRCRCRRLALSDRQAAQFQRADAKRMQDPVFAAARHTAQPDPGWDYNIGEAPLVGIERAIAQKVARLDHGLVSKLGTEIDDLRAAWPVRGLARRFPARDLGSLHTLLREYANRLPGDLPHGVKFVAEGGLDDDFYMGTDGQGGFYFREVEYGTFNSRRDLFGGLAKCADKQRPPMTQDEEYALESLWHEIWHNRQTGMDQVAKLAKDLPVRLFAETLNQVVARLTYPSFIERLGGQAIHQAWVLEHGYGYAPLVRRFRRVAATLGLEINTLAGDLATINTQADLLLGTEIVSRRFAKLSGRSPARIQAALDLLNAPESRFSVALGAIKSPL